MTKLTKAEADDLFEFLDETDSEPFELAPARGDRPAKVVQVSGASAAEFVKFVVRRCPAVKAVYVDGIRQGIAEARAADEAKAAAAAADVDVPIGTRRPKAAKAAAVAAAVAAVPVDPIERMILDGVEENVAEGGIEAKAMLVAVCVGRPGDEAFEDLVIGHPRFPALAALADRKTRGADPMGFSSDVSALILGQPATSEAEPAPEATAA